MKKRQEVPTRPRISINQLAKYLSVNAPARRRIILEQKQPKAFKVNYYDFSVQPIIEFFMNCCDDEEIIVKAIEDLCTRTAKSEYDETRLSVNAEALQAFLDSYDALNFDGLKPKQIGNNCPKIMAGGVDISVRPEILLSGTHKKQAITGAVKLYFGKNDPLTKESAPYISAVVNRFVDENYAKKGQPSRKHCQVFDVFAGVVFEAPLSTTKRFRDVEYACQEIAMWWNALENE